MAMSRDEIYSKVQAVLVDALGVDEDEVKPDAVIRDDLGAESIDFLDIVFRLEKAFNIKILRTLTTYQFSERFLMRNIMEYNNYDRTLGANLLLTYRVNAGTAFYVGYDDRYKQGDRINADLLPTTHLRRTNRAIFTKLQVLLRY